MSREREREKYEKRETHEEREKQERETREERERLSRVYVQDSPVCTFKTPVSHKTPAFWKYTRERFERTRGNVFSVQDKKNAQHTPTQHPHTQTDSDLHAGQKSNIIDSQNGELSTATAKTIQKTSSYVM